MSFITRHILVFPGSTSQGTQRLSDRELEMSVLSPPPAYRPPSSADPTSSADLESNLQQLEWELRTANETIITQNGKLKSVDWSRGVWKGLFWISVLGNVGLTVIAYRNAKVSGNERRDTWARGAVTARFTNVSTDTNGNMDTATFQDEEVLSTSATLEMRIDDGETQTFEAKASLEPFDDTSEAPGTLLTSYTVDEGGKATKIFVTLTPKETA